MTTRARFGPVENPFRQSTAAAAEPLAIRSGLRAPRPLEVRLTAQVAVLNTQGIALASDSAVTITGGAQAHSYQSADKIFPITAVPVAVLHSGNAALWGVPWQLLVEMWSKDREPVEKPSMEEYAREFCGWLVGQHALATEDAEVAFFRWAYRDYLLSVRGRIRHEFDDRDWDIAAGYVEAEQASVIDGIVDDYAASLAKRSDYQNMDGVDATAFCAGIPEELFVDLEWVFDDTPRTAHFDTVAQSIAELLVTKAEPFGTDAVLAFAGYGAADYFPSLYQFTVSGVLDGRVRLYDESRSAVDANARVSITPLGLTEAIQTFLRGTSPKYRAAAHEVLQSYADKVAGEQDAAASHTQLDEQFDAIEWKEFVSPMLDIVETMPMAETVRLADSLVGLASLRQMIQGQTSVGGPIDLARVTKHGGFEWIRSKKATTSGYLTR
jgi:hypothetical protein